MTNPTYSASDFARALQTLMPRGKVWPRDSDTTQAKVMAGLAAVYGRQYARAMNLLVDAFPSTTYELLPEWEATLGLPDACAGAAPTILQRRQQVVARLTNVGGQSIAYFEAFAAALGYAVTITQYTQARAGMLKAGGAVNGYDWNFAWKITAPLNTVVKAVAGAMAAGDPLAAWGNDVLECEFATAIPAQTTPIFAYA